MGDNLLVRVLVGMVGAIRLVSLIGRKPGWTWRLTLYGVFDRGGDDLVIDHGMVVVSQTISQVIYQHRCRSRSLTSDRWEKASKLHVFSPVWYPKGLGIQIRRNHIRESPNLSIMILLLRKTNEGANR